MSAEAGARPPRTYRLEPLDETGVLLGLSVLQCALVGGGVLGGALVLSAGLPLAAAALPPVAGAALSFVRVAAVPLWQWFPALGAWARTQGRGRRSWRAALPLWPGPDGAALPLPPVLEGLEVMEIDWRGARKVAGVRDRQRHTLCVVVPVQGPQFAVEDGPEQERLLAGWGDVLNTYATDRGPVVQIGWSDLAAPSGLAAHRAWVQDLAPPPSPALACYRQLLEEAAATATAHEVVVWMVVSAGRPGRARSGRGEAGGLAAAATTALESLLRALAHAGLSPGEPLHRGDLYRLLRRRADPRLLAGAGPAGRGGGRLSERLGLVTPAHGGPLALEVDWSQVRVDALYHRTYWVESWPRLAVYPAWLERFVAGGAVMRSLTVAFTPVPAYQARRGIERQLVRLESDAEVRQAKGRRVDARHRRATAALLEREEELVAGYAEMGYVGLVTVSAPTLAALEEAGEAVQDLARENNLALRPLLGRQDLGWAAALPLGLVGPPLVGG